MIASAFASKPPRPIPAWVRYASYVPLYGLGTPIMRLLDMCGAWPVKRQSKIVRGRMGDFADYRPDAHDVLVCAYFKSGTNWLLQTCVQIAFGGEAEFDHIHCVVPWPDAPTMYGRPIVPLDDASPREFSPSGLRIIKTHLNLHRIPFAAVTRYIAMVRDPKDVCVSGYHFLRKLVMGPMMPSVETWVKAFVSPDFVHGNWAVHLDSFWQMRHRPNVLFLTYEEMLNDPVDSTRRIARFMGVDLSPPQLEAVLQQANFDSMKRNHPRFEPPGIMPWSGRDFMMRKGRSGNSRELLTPAQQQRIDEHCRAELARLGCDFPYDETFCAGRDSEGRRAA